MRLNRRLHQVLRWLKDVYPHTHPVRLRVVKEMPKVYKGCLGVCVWNEKDEVMIWIQGGNRSLAVSTLLHEYTHVMTEGRGEAGGHGDEFYLKLGEIEREFYRAGQNDSTFYLEENG